MKIIKEGKKLVLLQGNNNSGVYEVSKFDKNVDMVSDFEFYMAFKQETLDNDVTIGCEIDMNSERFKFLKKKFNIK